jgi:hypothetical protein
MGLVFRVYGCNKLHQLPGYWDWTIKNNYRHIGIIIPGYRNYCIGIMGIIGDYDVPIKRLVDMGLLWIYGGIVIMEV